MLLRNMRISQQDNYDPKQRIVGGIVLFTLMMLLYYLLKILLGISSSGAAYALRNPLPEETLPTIAEAPESEPQTPTAAKPKYPIINHFVFLDLGGDPMDETIRLPADEAAPADVSLDELDGSVKWVVQAASLRNRSRAEALIEKLKGNGINAQIQRSGTWYVVRLPPQKERRLAEQQLQTLQRELGIKGLLMQK